MTPIKLIHQIISERYTWFKAYMYISIMTVVAYAILDVCNINQWIRIGISFGLILIFSIIFYVKISKSNKKRFIEANDQLIMENRELADLLLKNNLCENHQIQTIICELGKKLEDNDKD